MLIYRYLIFRLETNHVLLAGLDFEVEEAVRAFDLEVWLPASCDGQLCGTAVFPFKVYSRSSADFESVEMTFLPI